MANLTPFRYPGSKAKLLPVLMTYIDPLLQDNTSFIDVFVGGGSVLLEVATKYPKINLFANDKDYWIYCFWKIVSETDTKNIIKLFSFLDQIPTTDLFYKLRETKTEDTVECAYRAIFFNRTAFSGILSSGPIGGKEQLSKYKIDCRYNLQNLKEKIIAANKLLAGRTIIDNKDFSRYELLTKTNYPAYLDPPYFLAGKSLYSTYMLEDEHKKMANLIAPRDNWIISYDDCETIRNIYKNNNIIDLAARYCINGKKENWKRKNELIILPR